MTASSLSPESIRLARAAWDVATPGTRTLFFLRTKRAAADPLTGNDLDAVPFQQWDELTPETCQLIAWDVQFIRRVLGDGIAALKAPMAIVGGSVKAQA